ncbi:hypothetical protein HY990_00635 [Candidatus Micrarchaeota archaeon]|nr:hypothetical protein [Candidatus Micrarchaeota archaeon]
MVEVIASGISAKKRLATHQKGGPDHNKESGARDFWTKALRLDLQGAARTGVLPFSVEALIRPFPRFDAPPYLMGDQIFLDPKRPQSPSTPANLEFTLGDRVYSSPILFGEYSLGATQRTVHITMGAAAKEENFLFGIGEGGRDPYLAGNKNVMGQLATGVFGLTADILRDCAVISIKMSQSAKIGQGGMLPKGKATTFICELRGMPKGVDILSDASRVFSIEEVPALVSMVRAITGKPVFVKVGASHAIEFVAAGVARVARAGASGVIIDGLGGGTGAAPDIIRNYVGVETELAITLAHQQIESIGMRDNFKIIAAGRVDTPSKAMKLVLMGADGVLLGTGSLIALGCGMYHTCHTGCPPALTAVGQDQDGILDRAIDVGVATGWARNFYRAFADNLALCLAAAGFSSLSDARGHKEVLVGSGLPSVTSRLLGIPSPDPFVSYPPSSVHLDYFAKMREHLAQTGKYNVASMGATLDLDARYAISDYLRQDGRTVVGPSHDAYRDKIETHLFLANEVEVSTPLLFKEGSSDSARLSRESNSLLFANTSDGDTSRKFIPIKFAELDAKVSQIRQSAGVLLDESEATAGNIKRIKQLGNISIYCRVPATEDCPERAISLAKAGVDSIVVEGSFSMADEVPIEVAVAQVNAALENEFYQGSLLRRKVRIIADTQIRSARDIYSLNCLGADMVLSDPSVLIKNPSIERQRNLIHGLMQEYRMVMAASGLSMMSSIIGNRKILRADHQLPEQLQQLIGVEYVGL